MEKLRDKPRSKTLGLLTGRLTRGKQRGFLTGQRIFHGLNDEGLEMTFNLIPPWPTIKFGKEPFFKKTLY
jgi:hypothetical protein